MDRASLVNRATRRRCSRVNYTGIVQLELLRRGAVLGAQVHVRELGLAVHRPDQGHADARPVALAARATTRPPSAACAAPRSATTRTRAEGLLLPVDERAPARTTSSAGSTSSTTSATSNNHQSGSDYRDLQRLARSSRATTSTRCSTAGRSSAGRRSSRRARATASAPDLVLPNDAWPLNQHWSFNLGLRYDKNDGKDATGNKVVKDSAWSPRLSATFDPKGDGELDA